jgi:flagellar biosynthesis chaperone FliJ
VSSQRIRRAERIVALRQTGVDEAQTALAEAKRRAQEAEAAAAAAEALWVSETAAADHGVPSSVDLATLSAWLRSLRVQADQAAARAAAATKAVQGCHDALIAARSELRRIELWRDGIAAAARAEQDRKDRLAADEVTARASRRFS